MDSDSSSGGGSEVVVILKAKRASIGLSQRLHPPPLHFFSPSFFSSFPLVPNCHALAGVSIQLLHRFFLREFSET